MCPFYLLRIFLILIGTGYCYQDVFSVMGEFLSTSPSLSIETNDKNHTEASGFRRPSRWHVERVVIGHYSVSYLAVILHSPSHFYINCTFMKETITFSSLTLLHLFLKIRYSNHRLPMQIWTEKFVVSWCVVLSCYEKVTNYRVLLKDFH